MKSRRGNEQCALLMQAMCRDYYTLDFMDRSVDTSPIAPALAAFFDDVLDRSVSQLNFKVGSLLGMMGADSASCQHFEGHRLHCHALILTVPDGHKTT